MHLYLKEFLNVIRNCSTVNTYKMAWARALVELSIENPNSNKFYLKDISVKFFKYYWNQTIFFDLQQSPNPIKPPELLTYVKGVISSYQSEYGFKPTLFDKIEDKIRIGYQKSK